MSCLEVGKCTYKLFEIWTIKHSSRFKIQNCCANFADRGGQCGRGTWGLHEECNETEGPDRGHNLVWFQHRHGEAAFYFKPTQLRVIIERTQKNLGLLPYTYEGKIRIKPAGWKIAAIMYLLIQHQVNERAQLNI